MLLLVSPLVGHFDRVPLGLRVWRNVVAHDDLRGGNCCRSHRKRTALQRREYRCCTHQRTRMSGQLGRTDAHLLVERRLAYRTSRAEHLIVQDGQPVRHVQLERI